jgi:hypothetical protein
MSYHAAMTGGLSQEALSHLLCGDGQEDLCFCVWYPVRGSRRTTAVLRHLVLPEDGDRQVHGNASFNGRYFERALQAAMTAGGGLGFLHSHPKGFGWQGLSRDDHAAESGMAGAVLSATDLPLVGLTVAGKDAAWSGRFWGRIPRKGLLPFDCESIREVGDSLRMSFDPKLAPPPDLGERIVRTVSAWGRELQQDLSRLRVGVIGLGSVGSIVAEALARCGITDVVFLDFDSIERVNLDRTLHAWDRDADRGVAKVAVAKRAFVKSAVVRPFRIECAEFSVCEEEGYRRALDCDILFSCVDRPWPRSILNFISRAHLIPVVDGGIYVSRRPNGRIRGADWKAHISTVGRRCLECLSQYDPGLVAAERDGYLEDPAYMEKLPGDHPLKARENVFPFSLATASLEVLQMLAMVTSPAGAGSYGGQTYHFVTGSVDRDDSGCEPGCPYKAMTAMGEAAGHPGVIDIHRTAKAARDGRSNRRY